jgi:hypothetical protein
MLVRDPEERYTAEQIYQQFMNKFYPKGIFIIIYNLKNSLFL